MRPARQLLGGGEPAHVLAEKTRGGREEYEAGKATEMD